MIVIKLLGPTTVVHEGLRRDAADLGGVKPRQLLEMLALGLGSPMPKDLLAERLWEGHPPASYIATVESYVCVLRRRLGLARGRHAPLATTNSGYVLDPEQVQVDAVEIRSLLASGERADVTRALDLASGELLVDEPYAAWASRERESFAQCVAAACTGAAHAANAAGESSLAVRLARAAMARSYFSEPALRELMSALVRSGERSQALQVYEQLRAGMLEDLGIEPSPITQRLYLSILRGDSTTTSRETDRDEICLLLRLLRQALEHDSGSSVGEPAMLEVGRMLLARTG